MGCSCSPAAWLGNLPDLSEPCVGPVGLWVPQDGGDPCPHGFVAQMWYFVIGYLAGLGLVMV